MLFTLPEIVFLSVLVLALGGYRIYREAFQKDSVGSKWYAAGYFLCAGADCFTIFRDLHQGIAPGDLIPQILIAVVLLILGLLEVRRIRKHKNS